MTLTKRQHEVLALLATAGRRYVAAGGVAVLPHHQRYACDRWPRQGYLSIEDREVLRQPPTQNSALDQPKVPDCPAQQTAAKDSAADARLCGDVAIAWCDGFWQNGSLFAGDRSSAGKGSRRSSWFPKLA
jgi:hypothetical protein